MKKTDFRQAEFLASAHTIAQLPSDRGIEIAFAGRSNSGKSSVINIMTDHKRLARISKTPGRTRLINLFMLGGPDIRLADLPGYGYARVSQRLRDHWAVTLQDYFETRQSLKGLILITDIRRGLTDYDRQMLSWCRVTGLPVHILLNKADKVSFGSGKNVLIQVRKEVGTMACTVQSFSALNRQGVDELRQRLESWISRPETATESR